MPTISIEDIYWPTRLILYNRNREVIEGDTANHPNFTGPHWSSGIDAIAVIRKHDRIPDYLLDYEARGLYEMDDTETLLLLYPREDVNLPPIPDNTSDPAIIDEVAEKCKIWCALKPPIYFY